MPGRFRDPSTVPCAARQAPVGMTHRAPVLPQSGPDAVPGQAMTSKPMVLILMGVSGSGKSTVGLELADALGWPFFDGDDFHPPANVDKMSQGVPLTDEDRWPWLRALHDHISDCLMQGRSAIVACSALKTSYRDRLRQGLANVFVVYLRGEFEVIFGRMQARSSHFMKAGMLRSQFAALEEPQDAIVVDVDRHVDDIVAEIVSAVGRLRSEMQEKTKR